MCVRCHDLYLFCSSIHCVLFSCVAIWKTLLLINLQAPIPTFDGKRRNWLFIGEWNLAKDKRHFSDYSERCHFHEVMSFVSWIRSDGKKGGGKKCVISSLNAFLLPFAIVETFIQFFFKELVIFVSFHWDERLLRAKRKKPWQIQNNTKWKDEMTIQRNWCFHQRTHCATSPLSSILVFRNKKQFLTFLTFLCQVRRRLSIRNDLSWYKNGNAFNSINSQSFWLVMSNAQQPACPNFWYTFFIVIPIPFYIHKTNLVRLDSFLFSWFHRWMSATGNVIEYLGEIRNGKLMIDKLW